MGSLGIVIPAFNAGNLLSLAADSARVALGGTDDIVIVDDGSTKKGSLRILAGLEAQGYRVLRQDNRGVSAARNAGIRALRTPYVIALDSDDMITSDAVRLAGEILEQSPEVSIVAGSGVQIDEQGGRTAPSDPRPVSREDMWSFSLLPMASAFRRVDWERVGGFPEGVSMGEDWVFWMRLLRGGGQVAVRPEVFVERHVGRHQVTKARYIDPRMTTAAANLVLLENPDLALRHHDDLMRELAARRELVAAYRHSRRHTARARTWMRQLLKRP